MAEKYENAEFVTDRIQNKFVELARATIKNSNNYNDSIFELSNYLKSANNHKYDLILDKELTGISKELIITMIMSNFLEINFYRRESGIPLDLSRTEILKYLSKEESNQLTAIKLFKKGSGRLNKVILDDVLYYIGPHPKTYSYNIVEKVKEKGFDKVLNKIYPLSKLEHLITLNDTFDDKEYLLHSFKEVLETQFEKQLIIMGKYPRIIDKGLDDTFVNNINKSTQEIKERIFKDFNAKVDIEKGNNFNKILLLDMSYKILSKISELNMCTPKEKEIIDKIENIDLSLEDISKLYDENGVEIISTLINSIGFFDDDIILKDTDKFKLIISKEKVKRKDKKNKNNLC